jgi:hypothetical protein
VVAITRCAHPHHAIDMDRSCGRAPVEEQSIASNAEIRPWRAGPDIDIM